MARTVTFVIAPIGDGTWGLWLEGLELEAPAAEEWIRSSVRLRLEGVQERGDIGRLVVEKGPPTASKTATGDD